MAKKTMPQNVVKMLASRIKDEIIAKRKEQNAKRFADVKKTPEFKEVESKLKELNKAFENLKNLEREFESLRDACIDKHADDTFNFGWNVNTISSRSSFSYVKYVGEEDGKPKSLASVHNYTSYPTEDLLVSKITLTDYFAEEDMTPEEFVAKIVAQYVK